jgi:S-adenosylmethionine:tRNA ribosyltransferase-isomerase
MRTEAFDFDLPERLIALRPARPRDSARLLLVSAAGGLEDRAVAEAAQLFRAGDVLVFNDARVIRARLSGFRDREGAMVQVEATLHHRLAPARWSAFAKPGKRLRVGDAVRFGPSVLDLKFARSSRSCAGRTSNPKRTLDSKTLVWLLIQKFAQRTPQLWGEFLNRHTREDRACAGASLQARVAEKREDGEIVLEFELMGPDLDLAIGRIGGTPLPPYIASRRPEDEADARDYQTVYARSEGAVAAPTAGLHFTEALLNALDRAGVERRFVTLDVGAGTFLPVKAEDTKDHRMQAERRRLDEDTAEALNRARSEGRRVIAVGTTALRTLESAADESGHVHAIDGPTELFITPGFRFRVFDGLWTNFHLPRSTLFMLVAAFAGLERAHAAYAHAIARHYRFYSYGDACLFWRSAP